MKNVFRSLQLHFTYPEKKNKKVKVEYDEVDSGVAGLVDMRGAADKVQSLVQNVCSTLQTGVSSLTSNLPDLNQVSCQKGNKRDN